MADVTCSVSDCGRPSKARGLCHPHYVWSRANGWASPTHTIGRAPRPERSCSVQGCNGGHRSRGLCHAHYEWSRENGWAAPSHALGTLHRVPHPWARVTDRPPCAVPDCRRPARLVSGLCLRHLNWSIAHGGATPTHAIRSYAGPEDALRRKTRVDPETGCHIWTGSKGVYGYGCMSVGPRRRQGTHRFAYELKYGPIPEGMTLDHLCRNPSCVNPDHLEPVTNAENVKRAHDARKAGRAA